MGQWHPTPVLLPGKSYGWRSLVGCSPWGCEESDTTERLPFHFSLSCIGEGNGNPLQCPCLENPRDGGAWWAAVYGVAQSRTRLKRLSSSSSSPTNSPLPRFLMGEAKRSKWEKGEETERQGESQRVCPGEQFGFDLIFTALLSPRESSSSRSLCRRLQKSLLPWKPLTSASPGSWGPGTSTSLRRLHLLGRQSLGLQPRPRGPETAL